MSSSAITTVRIAKTATLTTSVSKRSKITVDVSDLVAVEAPLKILVSGITQNRQSEPPQTLVTTMRTPGEDDLLAIGYLVSEGILADETKLISVSRSIEAPRHLFFQEAEKLNPQLGQQLHLVLNQLPQDITEQASARRGVQSSSCGVCGKAALDDLLDKDYPQFEEPTRQWTNGDILKAQKLMASYQPLFDQTGGTHGVWLINQFHDVIAHHEDVGRHNCMDKLLGRNHLAPIHDLRNMTLILSSRLSYELVHKAAVLGVKVMACVGAPTSMALQLAEKSGITAIGFLKSGQFNLYTDPLNLFGSS